MAKREDKPRPCSDCKDPIPVGSGIPCRIIRRRGKRIEIAVVLMDGGEVRHLVDEKNLEHCPCDCFSECKAYDAIPKG